MLCQLPEILLFDIFLPGSFNIIFFDNPLETWSIVIWTVNQTWLNFWFESLCFTLTFEWILNIKISQLLLVNSVYIFKGHCWDIFWIGRNNNLSESFQSSHRGLSHVSFWLFKVISWCTSHGSFWPFRQSKVTIFSLWTLGFFGYKMLKKDFVYYCILIVVVFLGKRTDVPHLIWGQSTLQYHVLHRTTITKKSLNKQ